MHGAFWFSVARVLYTLYMSNTIILREANHNFSRCVRDVQAGEEYVITRNDTPVVRLIPVEAKRVWTPEQEAVWARTEKRWAEGGWDIGAGPLDRGSLYER